MSAPMGAPQSPYRPSWFYWSGRVWYAGCLGRSWWTHGAADPQHCCHDLSRGRSIVSLAEDPWLASVLASHPPPRSARYRTGSACGRVDVSRSIEVSVTDVNWIFSVLSSVQHVKAYENVYLFRQCSQWTAELGCRCLGFPMSATLKSSWQLSHGNFLQTLLKERGSRRLRTSFFIRLHSWSHTSAYLDDVPLKTRLKYVLHWTHPSSSYLHTSAHSNQWLTFTWIDKTQKTHILTAWELNYC